MIAILQLSKRCAPDTRPSSLLSKGVKFVINDLVNNSVDRKLELTAIRDKVEAAQIPQNTHWGSRKVTLMQPGCTVFSMYTT
jgi:hypothetical protein